MLLAADAAAAWPQIAAMHASLGTGRGFLLLCRRCCRPAMAKLLPLLLLLLQLK